MKKLLAFLAVAGLMLSMLLMGVPVKANSVTKNYGDVTLSGGFDAEHFSDIWDLTAGDLVLSFTYDANGLVDDFGGGAHAWAELGVRTVGYGDFNPTWDVEGAGVWLATDYDWTLNTFDPDPPGSPTLDLDDKLILQKAGGHGEGDYNLPSTPPNPGANHRVWFDRDGVDQWQAQNPLAVDGGTYNTGGTYDVVIKLHATSDTTGEAYITINGLDQGFETDGDWTTMELTPAGMTFTGDMRHMQVFYGLYGYGATHNVAFNAITVTGRSGKLPWKGVEWDAPYGSIDLVDGNLQVTTSSSWGAAHYNTPSDFRASTTPWVKVTFIDEGLGTAGGQLWMECEPINQGIHAWTQFGAWQSRDNYHVYWWNYDNDEYGWIDTGIVRSAGEHTLLLGRRVDGTMDYWLDGKWVFGTDLSKIYPGYFGDIYLAAHSCADKSSESVIFTDYQTGTDYTVEVATVDVNPDTLNLKSNGEWLTAYVTLPEGHNVENINPETVRLDGIPAVWSEIQDGVFMAKFDRAKVQSTLTDLPDYDGGIKFQEFTLTARGQLLNGQPFEGSDTIRAITK